MAAGGHCTVVVHDSFVQPRRYATLAAPVTTGRRTALLMYGNSTHANNLIIAIRCVSCKKLLACKPTTRRSLRRKLIDAEAAVRVLCIVLVVQVKTMSDSVRRDLTKARALLAFCSLLLLPQQLALAHM